MPQIELSKKIALSTGAKDEDLRRVLLTSLRRTFDIKDLQENSNGLHFRATTGGEGGMSRHAQVNIDIDIKNDGKTARVFLHGYCSMARSLLLAYSVLFLVVLLTGLLPGSVDTNGETSNAMDALVFIVFGIFIFYDVNTKLSKPKEHMQAALDSLETEFG